MEVRLTVACDRVRQNPDGKIDIYGVFTEVAGLGLLYLVPQMHLAVFFEANVAEVGTQKVHTSSASGGRRGGGAIYDPRTRSLARS